MALVIDDRCPARFVNDSRGITNKPNIHFMQHPDVRELLDKERLHLLLHAKVVLGIGAGEQLLCNYSDGYWQKSGGLEQSVPEEEEKVQDDADSEEDEPQDSENDKEDEESNKNALASQRARRRRPRRRRPRRRRRARRRRRRARRATSRRPSWSRRAMTTKRL